MARASTSHEPLPFELATCGRVYLSKAVVHGAFALRACFVDHRTTDADFEVEEVLAAAVEVA